MIRLDIFVDPVCPWCLVGKANLDAALLANIQAGDLAMPDRLPVDEFGDEADGTEP